MGLKNFQITFDNPWMTFYAGQAVTGKLLLTVDSPKKIRGIVIHFKGEASTKWDITRKTQNDQGQDENETVVYTGHETYFENKYNLVGGASGEITLQPGEQCYPFNTVLPPNLPSSFEGEFGHVRYTVKATLDRPWKFDQEAKAAFTVISPLDLNIHPTAKDPVKLTQEKFFCCCCCKSGPLTLVASLPASGYVSGQHIPVTVEVDNISQEEISNVTVTLLKHLAFTATSPDKSVKKDTIKISEINLGSVGKNGSQTWTEAFPIPPLPPSNLANCSLIDLYYNLKIEGKVSGMFHRNVDIKIPLVFGTIPLANFQPPAPVGGAGDSKLPVGNVGAGDGWGQGQPSYPSNPAAGVGPYPSDMPPQSYPMQGGFSYPGLPESGTGQPNMGMQPGQGMGYPGMAPQGIPTNETGQPSMGMQPGQGMGYPGMAPQGIPTNGTGQPSMGMQPGQGMGYPGMAPQGIPTNETGQPSMGMQPGQGMGYPGMAPQGVPTNETGQPNMQPGQGMGYPGMPPQGGMYPSLPPPSYVESTTGAKNIQDSSDSKFVQGNLDFTPRYPTYNYPNPYAQNK